MSGSQPKNSSASKSDGKLYIYEIPPAIHKELCRILERQNIWPELAKKMGYSSNQIEVNTQLTNI